MNDNNNLFSSTYWCYGIFFCSSCSTFPLFIIWKGLYILCHVARVWHCSFFLKNFFMVGTLAQALEKECKECDALDPLKFHLARLLGKEKSNICCVSYSFSMFNQYANGIWFSGIVVELRNIKSHSSLRKMSQNWWFLLQICKWI